MTRERVESATTYEELRDIDWELETYVFDDYYIYTKDSLDDYLFDTIRNWDAGWKDLRDFLHNIDDDYEWYSTEYEICGLCDGDYTFCEIKESIIERAENNGLFEHEEEQNEYDYHSTDHPEVINIIIEDFNIGDIFQGVRDDRTTNFRHHYI